jgi:D-xylonolactonase
VTVETLAWGYGLVEGPRAAPDGSLFFSDVRNGGVRRLNPDRSIDLVVPKRRGVGGIAMHADGGLVISGRNICHVRDGETRLLYERDDVGGFNDLFTDAQGRVYTGSLRDEAFTIRPGRRTGDAYRIDGPGQARTLYEGIGLSNGIGLSPDGRRLYHVDTAAGAVLVHEVDEAGDVDGVTGRVFATVESGLPDGLAVDVEGGVWVALYGGGGVARYTAEGPLDRRVDVPAQLVTSLCFAGPGLDELVVVTEDNADDPARGGSILRVSADEVRAVGLPAPLARI